MKDPLRDRIVRGLADAGIPEARDTTNPVHRPQWRLSFAYRGHIHGVPSYLHVYVPADAEQIQVNCAIAAPRLDRTAQPWIEAALASFNAAHVPGSPSWEGLLSGTGASSEDVAGWNSATSLHHGIQHRMILARVTMPLAGMTDRSIATAITLGLNSAKLARDELSSAAPGEQGVDGVDQVD